MQELLDIVNGEGKYADADMPQDNKNPIKVTKESTYEDDGLWSKDG